MTSNEFSKIEQEWYDMQHSILGAKADEYATEDRLHNFKAISDLTRGKVTPLQVAMILRGKQVISLYDRVFSDDPVTTDFFNEKAGDDANYLVLAKALHAEEAENDLPHQSKNLINILAEELIRNSKHYATMETDAEKEAFITARARQIIDDMFPSMKKIKEQSGSEHGGIIHHTPRNFYEEVVAHAKEDK